MVKKEDIKELKRITMNEQMTLNFWDLLAELLYYNANIDIVESRDEEKKEDYKVFEKEENVEILFKLENYCYDDFDIAVYGKTKADNEWEYLDNITLESYENGLMLNYK